MLNRPQDSDPQSASERNWWSSRGGKVYGPYDYQTVLFCRQDGRIVDDDYVKQGDGPWQRAADVLPAGAGMQPVGPATPVATPAAATAPARPARRSANTLLIALVVGGGLVMLLAALAIFAAILLPVFARAKGNTYQTQCMNNLKQLEVAVLMYAAEHEEVLPPADSWEEAIAEYISGAEILTCPATGERYIFNEALGGMDMKHIEDPAATPMLWEPAVDAEGLVGPHMGQFTVGYVDGHVRTVDTLPGAD